MESVLRGTLAPFWEKTDFLEEHLCLLRYINTQNRNLGQVETGLTFLGWLMTPHLPVRAIIAFAEPGTKKDTETNGKAHT